MGDQYQQQFINKLQHIYSFEGDYMSQEQQERVTIRKQHSSYKLHRQGLSSVLDQIWIHQSDNHYRSEEEDTAVLDQDTILVYRHGEFYETLVRIKTYCKNSPTPLPTDENCKQYYDVVMVHSYDQERLEQLLTQTRHCATVNDWNLTKSSIMARGAFVLDHAKTCFYFMSNDRLSILQHRTKLIPRLAILDEFQDRCFLGAMM